MAVIDVKEDWSKRAAPNTVDGQSATRGFTVLLDGTDDPELEPIVARQATGIPRIRQAYHSNYPLLRCISISPRAVGVHFFEVACQYGTSAKRTTEDPLDEPPHRSWTSVISAEPITYDIDGNSIENTAGKVFKPPITINVYDSALRITRNEATFNPVQQAEYRNTTNLQTFLGAPPGTARLVTFDGDEVIEADMTYWRVLYEIHFRLQKRPEDQSKYLGWLRRVANRGLMQYLGTAKPDGTPDEKNCIDSTGEPVREPANLALDGKQLAHGLETIWLYFTTLESKDWGALYLE